MMGALLVLGILFACALAIFVVGIGVYNALVTKRERYKNAYSQIDIQLKRRYDLIPNLTTIAERSLAHERDTLEAVIKARGAAVSAAQGAATSPGDAAAMKQLASADAALTGALGRLLVVSERYPELKANQNLQSLTEELSSTENKVAFARQAYNDSVMDYNTHRGRVPAVFFASTLGFKDAALLEAVEAPEERKAPKIEFAK